MPGRLNGSSCFWFQHTAARRRLGGRTTEKRGRCSFNTQPPEGGWILREIHQSCLSSFNTQPPEGGWLHASEVSLLPYLFQHTAARRRLAATTFQKLTIEGVSTHSRPKAAGARNGENHHNDKVSTHSRPKAADCPRKRTVGHW